MNGREQTEAWSLVAGDVALDFVNTVGGNDTTAHLDAIATYELLLLWSVRAGTVGQEQADDLLRRAHRRRLAADETLADAHALRRSLSNVFEALLIDAPVAPPWEGVRPMVAAAVSRAEPKADTDGLVWSWASETDLGAPLLPVAHAAADLLTSPRTELLRKCGRCSWLFLDQSRNHARRWCDMRTCGMAQKVERQADRRRGS